MAVVLSVPGAVTKADRCMAGTLMLHLTRYILSVFEWSFVNLSLAAGQLIFKDYYEISIQKHSEPLRTNIAGPHWALARYGQIFQNIS
jgi:hypothetical protein